jgi:hypothetical protein
VRGYRDVVESNDGDILGDAQIVVSQRIENVNGDLIIEGNNRGGSFCCRETQGCD